MLHLILFCKIPFLDIFMLYYNQSVDSLIESALLLYTLPLYFHFYALKLSSTLESYLHPNSQA